MPAPNLMPRAAARDAVADAPSPGTAAAPSLSDVIGADGRSRALQARDAFSTPIRDLKLRLVLCSSSSALGLLLESARARVVGGSAAAVQVTSLTLVTFAGVWCALPLHRRSLGALLNLRGRADAATLPSHARAWALDSPSARIDPALPGCLAILLGIAFSAVSSWAGAHAAGTSYPALVVWGLSSALLIGELMALLSRRTAARARVELLALLPEQARRVDDSGREAIVPLSALARGDLLRVRPRELVPADGVVIDGRSAVEERGVTGESLPVDKRAGALLIGGTRNGRGNLLMRVSRSGQDTLLAAIARLLGQAEQTRARLEHDAERAGSALAISVLVLAALAALIRLAAPGPVDVEQLVLASCTLLALASPRSLAHAVSLSFALGMARAARTGVIVRSAGSLETLERVDTLVVDKTGTLTEARPRVISVVTTEHASEPRLLSIAAGLLAGTLHPVAAAVATRAETLGVDGASIRERERLPGAGLRGQLDDPRGREHDALQLEVAVGSLRLLELLGVRDVTLEHKAEALCDHGQTVLFVVMGARVCGVIGVVDPIGLTTRDALRELEDEGVRLVLCSSDALRTTLHLGGQLGLSEVFGDRLPHEKAALVRELRAAGRQVAFASRSVDEDEAREAAHLSFQTNLEREIAETRALHSAARGPEPDPGVSAEVTLVRGDLAALARALRLARVTVRSARRSVQLGLAYHLLALALGVGIFRLMWDISLGPVQASMAAAGCFALLTVRALRLRGGQL
jgi:Cu+-exporting ATPase